MALWEVTYWDGSMLRKTVVQADPYNLMNAVQCSPAGSFIYGLMSIERIAA